MDWETINDSPIWNSENGFGGNGNVSDKNSVAYGYCVTDGPFAHLKALIFGGEANTHCLSRGFMTDEADRTQKVLQIRPDSLERRLDTLDYESFNLALEYGPHNSIPLLIRGDFFKVSAPNGTYAWKGHTQGEDDFFRPNGTLLINKSIDPVFFLHHTQLDRLWWMWQQRDPTKREVEYLGKFDEDLPGDLSLSDTLDVGDLAQKAQVSDVISTRTDLLCYHY